MQLCLQFAHPGDDFALPGRKAGKLDTAGRLIGTGLVLHGLIVAGLPGRIDRRFMATALPAARGRDHWGHQRLGDIMAAAEGAFEQAVLALTFEVPGRAEPALEVMVVATGKRVADHAAPFRPGCLGPALDEKVELACILQVRDATARRGTGGKIDVADQDARFIVIEFADNPAPRVDDQRMAEGLAPVLVQAALRGADHEGAVFDGAGADQCVPVRLAGLTGERRRRGQDGSPSHRLAAEQIGKAQIVADRQPQQGSSRPVTTAPSPGS